MKLQSYTVIGEIDTAESISVGQVVYAWPYADWGLAAPHELPIITRLQGVKMIYAVPEACLRIGEVVDAELTIGTMKMPPCSKCGDTGCIVCGIPLDDTRKSVNAMSEARQRRRRQRLAQHPDESKVAEIMHAVDTLVGHIHAGRKHVRKMIAGAFAELRAAIDVLRAGPLRPIDMVLHCPKCGLQHIDAPEGEPHLTIARIDEDAPEKEPWDNPAHRSHLCLGCCHVWRPADVATNGVASIKTRGKNDSAA